MERKETIRRVAEASGVAQKRAGAGGSIILSASGKKSPGANSRVEAAICVAKGKEANCRVVCAVREAKKRVLPFCSVPAGVTAVWRRIYGLRVLHERKAENCKCN